MAVRRWLIPGVFGVGAVAAVIWALMPDPVLVDLAEVRRGPMEVTVAAEGVTRIREIWSVTAPITGTTTRSPVQVGDPVVEGETVVAVVQPAAPAFLDARARMQAEAAVTEAQAAVRLAEVNQTRAEADLAYAEAQLARSRALAAGGIIAQRALDDTEQLATNARAAAEAARFDLDLRSATLARMEAQLYGPEAPALGGSVGECCIRLTAPHTGTVLEVADVSARLVQAGSPLVTIGDLQDLKIEVDLLSSDAVRVREGAAAHVERWGGEGVIEARVERVDPAGFARVSALGIEEQRVRVHLDILTPPEERPGLGDSYRVFVRVVVWSGEDILQVPQSALFRQDGGWAVFRLVEGRAALTPVTLGQRQDEVAEVLTGLNPGDQVVAFPGASVSDGVRLEPRAVAVN